MAVPRCRPSQVGVTYVTFMRRGCENVVRVGVHEVAGRVLLKRRLAAGQEVKEVLLLPVALPPSPAQPMLPPTVPSQPVRMPRERHGGRRAATHAIRGCRQVLARARWRRMSSGMSSSLPRAGANFTRGYYIYDA